jgi:hypothetical protein
MSGRKKTSWKTPFSFATFQMGVVRSPGRERIAAARGRMEMPPKRIRGLFVAVKHKQE